MVFSEIMQRFQAQAPIPVMGQALLERVLVDDLLDACFERVTQKQYTRGNYSAHRRLSLTLAQRTHEMAGIDPGYIFWPCR